MAFGGGQSAPLPQGIMPPMGGASGGASGGGMPMPPSPPMGGGGVGNGNPYPTTDPRFVDALLSQLLQAQQQDQAGLQQGQDAAVQQSQMMHALLAGAPMGPGAGQDAQSIGMDPSQMPALPGSGPMPTMGQ